MARVAPNIVMRASCEELESSPSFSRPSCSSSFCSPFRLVPLENADAYPIFKDHSTNLWFFSDCETAPVFPLEIGSHTLPVVRCTKRQASPSSTSSSSSSSFSSPQSTEASAVLEVAQKTDLLKGVYEGGFKIWECSVDLLLFVKERLSIDPHSNSVVFSVPTSSAADPVHVPLGIDSVLELGCGIGLPALFILLFGLHTSPLSVHFQDYNFEVLEQQTIPTVVTNVLRLQNQEKLGDIDEKEEVFRTIKHLQSSSAFIAGDWANISADQSFQKQSYKLILAAETLYNKENHKDFFQIVKQSLRKPDGIALIASKVFYFGVGGGTNDFQKIVDQDQEMECFPVKRFVDGQSNVRQILLLRFRSSPSFS
eukprot:TRINITY_DN5838_c0_g1_i1.p1 TRINITY_DN5838_c0_g1~~TRINITY_DN5838_c0_g1_i1.p1  ORF type:complete len:407 (-),score=138.70 TRINITY_DN5838_c0_g1_i1:22-1125(-)